MIIPKNDPSKNIALPKLPDELKGLGTIALNLWWTWNPRGKRLFKNINHYLWKESGHNPIKLLNSLDSKELLELISNDEFMKEYKFVLALFEDYINDSETFGENPLPVAYFCAEYGLHHSVPIYSGGLGFLAGDILKEASDLNLPFVGVGFMYPQGYIRQIIGSDGWQNGTNETIDKDNAPIERVLDKDGKHFVVKVPFIEPTVYVAVWKINVGRVTLYLLDTDIKQNDPWDREISSHLYTPDMHQRLRQQIVLGIGGYRVLEELGIKYSILHLNEGHPAFALFERVRNFIENGNLTLDEALKQVSETSIFTTHTPLQAATDVYNFDMVSNYFEDYWKRLGMTKEQFFNFGINPDQPKSGFNMTVLGLKMCQYKNAVSKKHCDVTKKIWKNVFQNSEKNPIDYVTNGVHIPTWICDELRENYDKLLGSQWQRLQDEDALWSNIEKLDNEKLWHIHYNNKVAMVNFIRERVRQKWSNEGIDPLVAMAEGVMLDPDILTIGFARRMTSYKRADLILKDLDRLEQIICNKNRPVQIIFAGKAHPSDNPGKEIIKNIFKTAQNPKFKGRIAFIEDYGEEVAKYLTRGVDVWLNNPQIPLEACGTSGMKASINGVLHFSAMDGWWPEAYDGKNGWKIGAETSDDIKDADSIYQTLEQEIIPLFYNDTDKEFPQAWTEKMKYAISTISSRFGARRMMKEYLSKFYIPITQGEKK